MVEPVEKGAGVVESNIGNELNSPKLGADNKSPPQPFWINRLKRIKQSVPFRVMKSVSVRLVMDNPWLDVNHKCQLAQNVQNTHKIYYRVTVYI